MEMRMINKYIQHASSSSEPIIVKRKLSVLSEEANSEIMQKTFTMHPPNPVFTVVLRRCTSNLTIHTSKKSGCTTAAI
jgi:hypothetical protein